MPSLRHNWYKEILVDIRRPNQIVFWVMRNFNIGNSLVLKWLLASKITLNTKMQFGRKWITAKSFCVLNDSFSKYIANYCGNLPNNGLWWPLFSGFIFGDYSVQVCAIIFPLPDWFWICALVVRLRK